MSRLRGELTVARLRVSTGYSKLSAEASATRRIIEFAREMARKYTHDERVVVALVTCVARFYRVLEPEGFHLSDACRASVAKLGRQICALYGAVNWFEIEGGTRKRGLPFWQTLSHAITLNDSIPADCLVDLVHKTGEILYHKQTREPQAAPKVMLKWNFATDRSNQSTDTTDTSTLQSVDVARCHSPQSSGSKPVIQVVHRK